MSKAQHGEKNLLVFSQVYLPDPASVGQHIADVAAEMVGRGYRVRVYTADRGYEDPSRRYPRREVLSGVEVRRLPFSSFGKRSMLHRLAGTVLFLLQCTWISLTTPRLSGILFSTSPPLVGIAASLVRRVRGTPIAYWVMDLNPDQLIALGKLSPTSWVARVLESVNRFILRSSSVIFTLDRLMADRIRDKDRRLNSRIVVIPPWPHEEHIEPTGHSNNPFRTRHSLDGQFVVMYSGNHSPSNPLSTLLQAAVQLRDRSDIRFVFVGGGLGKKEVETFAAKHRLANVVSLPYQPITELKYSLSAADVHVVSLGEAMAGVVHPCKVYGAMAAARPILYFGPRPSHVTDILDQRNVGWHVDHGDVAAATSTIEHILRLSSSEREQMGEAGLALLDEEISQRALCNQFCDYLETALGCRSGSAPEMSPQAAVSY